jgi:tetratricopeptide (TPR) repeat protein
VNNQFANINTETTNINEISDNINEENSTKIEELNLLTNEQNFDEVIPIFESLYENNPTDVTMLINYANTLMHKWSVEMKEEEYWNQAIILAKKVLEIDSKNSEAWRIIWYSNEIMEKYDESLKAYNKAIILNSNNALAYSNRWHAYKLLWNLEKAEIDFLKAYGLDDTMDHVIINLATIYLGKADNEKAIKYYNKVIDNSLNTRFKSEALYSIWSIKLNNENLEEANEYFEKAKIMDSKFELPYIWLSKAQFLFFLQQVRNKNENIDNTLVDKSLLNLDTAISINPNKSIAYYQLALIYLHLKKFDKTESNFKKALEVIPNDITLSKNEKEAIKNLINNYYTNE